MWDVDWNFRMGIDVYLFVGALSRRASLRKFPPNDPHYLLLRSSFKTSAPPTATRLNIMIKIYAEVLRQ